MNHFYEVWEHYILDSKAQRPATDYLKFHPGREMELDREGKLNRSHGMSYYLCRQVMERAGDEMGLTFLANHPELTYAQCVEATKGLD